MKVSFSNDFKKKLNKHQNKIISAFYERLQIFMNDGDAKVLNNHYLKGKYEGYKSINVTGDFRAVYKLVEKEFAYFVDIDNHGNLYK